MESKDASQQARATLTEEVRHTLIDRIRRGHYRYGQKLPGEVELARELDVSIAPIRTALAQLVSAGIVNRRAGSGTYVSPEPLQHELSTWTSFTQELRRLGVQFETHVKGYGATSDVPERVTERFSGLKQAPAMRLERTVEFDERVRIFTRSWFRSDVLGEVPNLEYFTSGDSLYSWFRGQGEGVVFAETRLQVTFMDDQLAGRFGAEWGTPVVLLEGTAYTRSGQIEYSETYYDHSSFTFTATYATRTGLMHD